VIYSDVIESYKDTTDEIGLIAEQVQRVIAATGATDILDLGSGSGRLAKLLVGRGGGLRVTCIDAEAQIPMGPVEFIQADIRSYPLPACDLIVLSHVLPDIPRSERNALVQRCVDSASCGVVIVANRLETRFGRLLLALWSRTDGFSHFLDWPQILALYGVSVIRGFPFVATGSFTRNDFVRCLQLFTPTPLSKVTAERLSADFFSVEGDSVAVEVEQLALWLVPDQCVTGGTLVGSDVFAATEIA
jgi:SAM-dependent methyltransferase